MYREKSNRKTYESKIGILGDEERDENHGKRRMQWDDGNGRESYGRGAVVAYLAEYDEKGESVG